jgi:hypothetical protein
MGVTAMDHVFRTFLENTASDAAALQQKSAVVAVDPLPPIPPSRYVCTFRVSYLRRLPTGIVDISPGPVWCGISLPEDYLRSTDPRLFLKIASIGNADFLHPNVLSGAICLGSHFAPGTPIDALIWELFEIVTYRNCTVDERNALNPEACRLLREHPSVMEKLPRPPLFQSERGFQTTVRPA